MFLFLVFCIPSLSTEVFFFFFFFFGGGGERGGLGVDDIIYNRTTVPRYTH